MAFVFGNTFNEMASSLLTSFGKDSVKYKSQINDIFDGHRKEIEKISRMALAGDLTEPEFESEMKDELVVFESELLALKVAGKASVQRAINGAVAILIKAIYAKIL
jgi:hypothetical protein